MNTTELNLLYFRFTDIWKQFCELHNDLFFLSLDEYSYLLSSDVETIEAKVSEKKEMIERIRQIEQVRTQCFNEIQTLLGPDNNMKNFRELIDYFSNTMPEEKEHKHLQRFNNLLIDLIGKIKDQNKKTQLFINKAIYSLQTIRDEAMGVKPNTVYNKKGVATKNLTT